MSMVIHLASRRAVQSLSPVKGNPHQHFADAANGLSMAARYLRDGNIAGAQRKAVQALAALRQLQAVEGGAQ